MNTRTLGFRKHPRRGSTLVLAAVMLTVMMAMVAFAVDVGYIVLGRTQLQVAADSAAMSAAAANVNMALDDVIAMAKQYAGRHVAAGGNVELNSADIQRGDWDFSRRTFTPSTFKGNGIRIVARRDASTNGKAPLFFARVFGAKSTALQAEAVAALIDNFSGFRVPSSGENLPILPFAVRKETWDALLAGRGEDRFSWNPESGQLQSGPDGIVEAHLFPEQTGAPGNFGTVDIGSPSNSTADLARQIVDGVDSQDLSYLGGSLQLNQQGTLQLNGNTGLSNRVRSELAAIKGKPRIVPLYSEVRGSGNNAQYTIVGFAGVRITDVQLTGSLTGRAVTIQRADVVVRGGIPAEDGPQKSYSIFSPVCLVR